MKRLPLFHIGIPLFVIGLLTVPIQQRPGLDWAPWAQAAIGLTLIVIKLVWVIGHRRDYR